MENTIETKTGSAAWVAKEKNGVSFYSNGAWKIQYHAVSHTWQAAVKAINAEGAKVWRYQFSAATLASAKAEVARRTKAGN